MSWLIKELTVFGTLNIMLSKFITVKLSRSVIESNNTIS
ncbi:hypothetical protein Xmir_00151 [Xenorhabdus miraniensis]|uniref:Uncharacterized protein n=1 Tax=Xenorhabdus miraniensis TaxID=351674 RepID=A0A2D0JWP6_9GAMM|nr:hypothetical protein Xmir_00151 [Xenorhabdus miraniensis]